MSQHKKKFYFVQSSSAPYKCDLGASINGCPQSVIDTCGADVTIGHLINLPRDVWTGWQSGLRKAQNIDVFRTGYNCTWWARPVNYGVQFQFENNELQQAAPSVEGFTERREQEIENKYAFVIVPKTLRGEYSTGAPDQSTRNIYKQETILESGYMGYPFSNPVNSVDAVGFLWQQKYEFQISPPFYPQIFSNAAERTNFGTDASIPSYWRTNTDWNNWVSSSFHNKRFHDVAFSMDWPFGIRSIDQMQKDSGQSIRNLYVKIEPSYNYYIKSYEDLLWDTRALPEPSDPGHTLIPETLLPNLYVFASELDNRFEDQQVSRFQKHINLVDNDGRARIAGIFQDMLQKGGSAKRGEKDEGQYFEKWASAMDTETAHFHTTNRFSNLKTQHKTLIFPESNLDLLQNHKGDERLFPMHIKIEFATDINTEFSEMYRDAKMTSMLLWILALGDTAGNPVNVGHMNPIWDRITSAWSFSDWEGVEKVACDYVNNYTTPLRMFDIARSFGESQVWRYAEAYPQSMEFLGDMLESNDRIETFLGRYSEELAGLADPQNALFVELMMRVLFTKFMEFMKPTSDGGKFRSLQEILQGKMAYNETLAYKMTKMNVDTGEKHYVWFPNSSDIDVLSYIDTQVKPNTPYRYIIEAWQLVFGNETAYQVSALGGGTGVYPGQHADLDEFNARLCVFNRPRLKCIPVPYYDSVIDYPGGIQVVDRPPVRPDINIIPYQGVSNKVLFWLNGNVGDYWEEPIPILPTDDFSTMLRFHGKDTNGDGEANEVNFRSDDHVTQFQIFRIEKRPKKYLDFSVAKPMLLVADGATAASHIDTIEPNREYYYTFRAIDNHGNLSNPSSVYKIEIEKTNDDIYFYISIINMGLDPERQIAKPARRYIQIKAALGQTILNSSELATVRSNGDTDKFPLLLTGDGEMITPRLEGDNIDKHLWGDASEGRKFKIRLRSKQSGKKIDFNIQFRQTIGNSDGISQIRRSQSGDESNDLSRRAEELLNISARLPGLDEIF